MTITGERSGAITPGGRTTDRPHPPPVPVTIKQTAMTSTAESYATAAGQVRSATEQTAEVFRQAAKAVSDRAAAAPHLPQFDLVQPVQRYFDYLPQTIDVSRDLATRWVELAGSLSGAIREQTEKVGHLVAEQADTVADQAIKQAEKAERIARGTGTQGLTPPVAVR